MFDIRADDLTGLQTRALLALHLAGMRTHSPPDGVFALDLTDLQSSDVTVWTLWDGAIVMGIGALRTIAPGFGEIKSMRTHPDHLRKGVGSALLRHIIATARLQGMSELSLETGSGSAFDAALNLYRAYGFTKCDAFGAYEKSAFNLFLRLKL